MLIKRLYFTLLELMIVLAIVALISGIVGINVSKAVREQHFRAEVDLVVNQLRLAQEMMLLFNADVVMNIARNSDSSFSYQLQFPNGLPKNWGNIIKGEHQPLTYISAITFDTHTQFSGGNNDLDIKFGDKGIKMSRGVLRLATTSSMFNGTLERFICLPGYPFNIVSVSNQSAVEACMTRDDQFDRQLTQRTIEEVNEKS